ncbi:MAG: molecular chaperone DnaJ [Deltaproteobacteria bacterium]|nr:molecular chaperone DnaJ [Deltaproteobacteria bacterium]
MAKRDFYEVLGVPRDANDADIKRAFRQQALQNHPDRNPGDTAAEERFKEAAEAYDVLADSEKRQRYDRFGHAGLGGGGGANYANMDDLFSHFGDIFGDIFGGGGRSRQRQGGGRGADLRCDIEITLEEAVAGARRELELPRLEPCASCHGSGAKPGSEPDTCGQCRGRGQVSTRQGPFMFSVTCPACAGQGKTLKPANRCATCDGAGQQRTARKVTVKVPPGVDTGNRLRVTGEGERGGTGQPAGDLYVVVHVQAHPRFRRIDNDLHCDIEVDVVSAVLGGLVGVPLIDGSTERVKLPAGIQPGEQLRIRGRGVPVVNTSARGDQFAHVRVVVPKKLSAEQRALYEQLAATNPAPAL